MKKIYPYFLSLVLMLFSLTSCWDNEYLEDFEAIKEKATEAAADDPGSGSMSCNDPSTIKAPYHCLTNQGGATTVFKYGETGVVGTWTDSDICLTFNANGTGTYKYKKAGGGSSSFPIKWGMMVDSKGKEIVDNSGQVWYLFMEGSQVDPQIASMPYKFSTKELVNFGFTKKSCNF